MSEISHIGTQDFVTCDLLDDNPDKNIFVIPPSIDGKSFKHFGGRHRFYGQIVTVKCFEDNSKVKELLATSGHGRVLVVDGGASLRCALMGDMIAKSATDNGWAGVVVYGCVRDVDELAKLPLGVMALSAIPKKSVRKGVGEVGICLNIGGISITEGAYLYADNNGVLICVDALI